MRTRKSLPDFSDRYVDSAISRQRLLNYQRVKTAPNELILAKLQLKKKKLRKTKNLKTEIKDIRRQQRRFEKGEKRDKPEDDVRIVGDPIMIKEGGGIAFDPEIEKEKIKSNERIQQQKINLIGYKLRLEEQKEIERRRQFDAELIDRGVQRDFQEQQLRLQLEEQKKQFDANFLDRGIQRDFAQANFQALDEDTRRKTLQLEGRLSNIDRFIAGLTTGELQESIQREEQREAGAKIEDEGTDFFQIFNPKTFPVGQSDELEVSVLQPKPEPEPQREPFESELREAAQKAKPELKLELDTEEQIAKKLGQKKAVVKKIKTGKKGKKKKKPEEEEGFFVGEFDLPETDIPFGEDPERVRELIEQEETPGGVTTGALLEEASPRTQTLSKSQLLERLRGD
tara:strand:+ start:18 stop:1211 length:1194 start_codon:yes stop_codon:yes gene_type:complete